MSALQHALSTLAAPLAAELDRNIQHFAERCAEFEPWLRQQLWGSAVYLLPV